MPYALCHYHQHLSRDWVRERAQVKLHTQVAGPWCFTLQGSAWFGKSCTDGPVKLTLSDAPAASPSNDSSTNKWQSEIQGICSDTFVVLMQDKWIRCVNHFTLFLYSKWWVAQKYIWIFNWVLIGIAWNLKAMINKNAHRPPHILEILNYRQLLILICSLFLDNLLLKYMYELYSQNSEGGMTLD